MRSVKSWVVGAATVLISTMLGGCQGGSAPPTGAGQVEPPLDGVALVPSRVTGPVGSCHEVRMVGAAADGISAATWSVSGAGGRIDTTASVSNGRRVCFDAPGHGVVSAAGHHVDAWIWDATLVARAELDDSGGFVHSSVPADPGRFAGPGSAPIVSAGLSLAVPTGALAQPTEIRVLEATDWRPWEGAGRPPLTWQLLPAGLVPSRPLVARLPIGRLVDGLHCQEVVPRLRVTLASEDGTSEQLDPIDFDCAAGWLSVAVPHFSTLSVADLGCFLDSGLKLSTGEYDLKPFDAIICTSGALTSGDEEAVVKGALKLAKEVHKHLDVLLSLDDALDAKAIGEALAVELSDLSAGLPGNVSVEDVAAHTALQALVWQALNGKSEAFAGLSTFGRYRVAMTLLGAPDAAERAGKVIQLVKSDLDKLINLIPGAQVFSPIQKWTGLYADALELAVNLTDVIGWRYQLELYGICRDGGSIPAPTGAGPPELCVESPCSDPCCVGEHTEWLCGTQRPFLRSMTFADPEVVAMAEVIYQIGNKSEADVEAELSAARALVLEASKSPLTSLVEMIGETVCEYLEAEAIACATDSGLVGRRRCTADQLQVCDTWPNVSLTLSQEQFAVSPRVDLTMQLSDGATGPGEGLVGAQIDWGDGDTELLPLSGTSATREAGHVYRAVGRYDVVVTVVDAGGKQVSAQRNLQVALLDGATCGAADECPAGTVCDCANAVCWMDIPELGLGASCAVQEAGGCKTSDDCTIAGRHCYDGECIALIPRGPSCEAGSPEACGNGIDDDCDDLVDELDCQGSCASDAACPSGRRCHCASGACVSPALLDALGGGCDEPVDPCFDKMCDPPGASGGCGTCTGAAQCAPSGRCSQPPIAVLTFDRLHAFAAPGDTARFNYDTGGSADPDGDPLSIVSFESNGVDIGVQSDGSLHLGEGSHAITVTLTDGVSETRSLPVTLTVERLRAPDTCDDLPPGGICQGTILLQCVGGGVVTNDCASTGAVCGWDVDADGFGCVEAAGFHYVAVDAGGDVTCAIAAPGRILCWGGPDFAQEPPPDGYDYTQISVSRRTACALRADGSLVCWGRLLEEEVPPPQANFAAVSTGDQHACGLDAAGAITCWGEDRAGKLDPPAGSGFLALAAGEDFTCALNSNSMPQCWGGFGDEIAPPAVALTSITAGDDHVCGLRSDSTVLCWGDSDDNKTNAPSGGFMEVVAGDRYTCARRPESGAIQCWGRLFGNEVPPPEASDIVAMGVGDSHACGVTSGGSMGCWGDTYWASNAVPTGDTFVTVEGAWREACAARSDGSVLCWGDNLGGLSVPPDDLDAVQLAVGGLTACALDPERHIRCWGYEPGADLHPDDAPSGAGYLDVCVGWDGHACAIRSDGTPTCWGGNFFGQATPPPGLILQDIDCGRFATCGLDVDGSLMCWGSDLSAGAEPPPGNNYVALSMGWQHSCALTATGTVACWGAIQEDWTTPPAGVTFQAVASGRDFSCGLVDDGTLACWGDSLFQSGANTLVAPAPYTFVGVAAANNDALGLLSDGSLQWGGYEYKEIIRIWP